MRRSLLSRLAIPSSALLAATLSIVTGVSSANATRYLDSVGALGSSGFSEAIFQLDVLSFYDVKDYLDAETFTRQLETMRVITNLPGFWSDMPTLYRVSRCTATSPDRDYFYLANIAALEQFSDPNFDLVNGASYIENMVGGIQWSTYQSPRTIPPSQYVLANQTPYVFCDSLYTQYPNWVYPAGLTWGNNSATGLVGMRVGAYLGWSTWVNPGNPSSPYAASGAYITLARTGGDISGATLPEQRVYFTVSGSAVLGVDYVIFSEHDNRIMDGSGGTSSLYALFPATWRYSDLRITPLINFNEHPEKTVIIQLASGTSSYLFNPVGTRIQAVDYPDVTVAPFGSTTLTPNTLANGFRISRAGGLTGTTDPLAVYYTITGSATNGTDYNLLSGSVIIPAGQTTVNVPIQVPERTGGTAIAAKTITVAAQPQQGVIMLTSGSDQPITFTIPAYNPSTLSLTTSDPSLNPGEAGSFTITRTGGDLTQALPVNLTLGGSAANGVDYSTLPTTVAIPANQTSTTVNFTTTAQSGAESIPQKDMTVALTTGGYAIATSNNQIAYTIGAYTPATLTVAVSNGGTINRGTSGGFTITRSGNTTQPLSVNYSLGGSATPATDYTALTGQSGTVTIPAGQASIQVPVSVPGSGGSTPIPQQTIVLTLQAGNGYSGGGSGTLTIPAFAPSMDPKVTVSLSAGDSTTLSPGSIHAVTFTRAGLIDNPLPIQYQLQGTAINGQDYGALDGSTVIPSGLSSISIPITIPASLSTTSDGRTLEVKLSPGNYEMGSNQSVMFVLEVPNAVVVNGPFRRDSGSGQRQFSVPTVNPDDEDTDGQSGAIALPVGLLAAGGISSLIAISDPTSIACSPPNRLPAEFIAHLEQRFHGQPIDWSQVSFATLPAIDGIPADQVLKLSEFHELSTMRLEQVSQMLQGLPSYTLAASGLVEDTTLRTLSATLYTDVTRVGDIPGLADYLSHQQHVFLSSPIASVTPARTGLSVSNLSPEQLSNMDLQQLLGQYPALMNLNLGNLRLTDVPGLLSLPLSAFPDYDQMTIARVPGLSQIPFTQLFPCLVQQQQLVQPASP